MAEIPRVENLLSLLALYEGAKHAGTRHLAQVYRVKCGLMTGDFNAPPFADETPLGINPRLENPPVGTVAFLASINQLTGITFLRRGKFRKWDKVPCAHSDSIFLLRRGLNRVGSALGHYDCTGLPWTIDEREWVVDQGEHTALVTEDGSEYGSVIVPVEHPRFAGVPDPRYDERAVAFGNTWKFLQRLQHGDAPYELREGDVLLTVHDALVYGLATYPGEPPPRRTEDVEATALSGNR